MCVGACWDAPTLPPGLAVACLPTVVTAPTLGSRCPPVRPIPLLLKHLPRDLLVHLLTWPSVAVCVVPSTWGFRGTAVNQQADGRGVGPLPNALCQHACVVQEQAEGTCARRVALLSRAFPVAGCMCRQHTGCGRCKVLTGTSSARRPGVSVPLLGASLHLGHGHGFRWVFQVCPSVLPGAKGPHVHRSVWSGPASSCAQAEEHALPGPSRLWLPSFVVCFLTTPPRCRALPWDLAETYPT